MPPNPPIPHANSTNDGEAAGRNVINSTTGWNALTRSLSVSVPHRINSARRATASVHNLIRTGR